MPHPSTLAALLLALTACASSQSVHLPVAPQSETALGRVVIEDARPAADRELFSVVYWGQCIRSYGDNFIEPTKLAYLRSFLAERLAPKEPLTVRIERFDTIERCLATQARSVRAAQQGALAGATGGRVWVQGGKAQTSGDDFTLQLAGTVNGVPFSFRGSFDYGDLVFASFPSGNAKYRARIERLFGEFVQVVRSPAGRRLVPASEFVNVRALAPAPAAGDASGGEGT